MDTEYIIMLAVRLYATGKKLHQREGLKSGVFVFSVPPPVIPVHRAKGPSWFQSSTVTLRVEVGKTPPDEIDVHICTSNVVISPHSQLMDVARKELDSRSVQSWRRYADARQYRKPEDAFLPC